MRRPPHIVRLQVLRILAKEIDKVTEQLGELQTVRRESPVSACFVSSNLEKFCIFFLKLFGRPYSPRRLRSKWNCCKHTCTFYRSVIVSIWADFVAQCKMI
jgi:hypothetical protein